MSTSDWSLGGDPPGPASMPAPTPEQEDAIREELAPIAVPTEEDRLPAIERGMAAGTAPAQTATTPGREASKRERH